MLQRSDKEQMLEQRGCVVWMTGLSGSGKSTIAIALERRLHHDGFFTTVLDGDNVRTGINNNLGFSETDRVENVRRIAEVAKLFASQGIVTICCFVSPTLSIRAMAKEIVGAGDFVEAFVDTPLEVCEARDVKGLYAKARKGEVKDFTGISAPFEAPVAPEVRVPTAGKSIEESTDLLYRSLLGRVQRPQ
jgi:adenylylsulfate kinase